MRKLTIVVAALIVMVLTFVSGSVPASAGFAAGGRPDWPVVAFEFLQPGSPTGLTAMAVSGSEVDLSWTGPTGGVPAASYYVYDGTSSGGESATPVNSSPVTGTSFAVTGLAASTTYYFIVTAVDRSGNEGDPSGEASASTASAPPPGQTGSSAGPGVAIVLVVIGGAVAGIVIWRRRRRSRSGPTGRAAVRPRANAVAGSIRAEPHAGPPPAVSVQATGKGVTRTVRFVPYAGESITTIEEAPPR
jgi:hypothetical protein